MLITALLVTAALTGAPAPEPVGDPDSVVATAPATPVDLGATAAPEAPSLGGAGQSAGAPHGRSTDQQAQPALRQQRRARSSQHHALLARGSTKV